MKVCTKCKSLKSAKDFSPNRHVKSGLQSWCKVCVANQTRPYNAEKQRIRYQDPEYRAKQAEQQKKYKLANKHKVAAYKQKATIQRRSRIKQVVPSWVDKELEELVFSEAYSLAELRRKMFGYPWHVDHVIPLCGKTVSGFHISSNIQVIPASVNLRKSNKYLENI